MNWLDVCGPPGSGKSTVCYDLWQDREITWDGLPIPSEWREFVEEIGRLLSFIASKPPPFIPELGRYLDLVVPAARMNQRTLGKMSVVQRTPETSRGAFVQTAFCQRVLGFGWRLTALNEPVEGIRRLLELMPTSLGVVFLEASEATIVARNKERLLNPATAHENRGYQARLMAPAITFAKQELRDRGVPILELDVEHQSPDESRAQILEFARAQEGVQTEMSVTRTLSDSGGLTPSI